MTSSKLDQLTAIQTILWGALTGSILLYGVVLLVVVGDAPPERSEFRSLFHILSILVGVTAILWRGRSLSEAACRRRAAASPDAGGEGTLAERKILGTLVALQSQWIVVLALHEAIALFGFVLGFLEKDFAAFVPFAVVAIVLQITVFPRPRALAEKAKTWPEIASLG